MPNTKAKTRDGLEQRRQRIRELRSGRCVPVTAVAAQLRAEGYFRSDLSPASCERLVRRDLHANRKDRRLGKLAPVLQQLRVYTLSALRALPVCERIAAAASQVTVLRNFAEVTDDPTARDQAERRIHTLTELIRAAELERMESWASQKL